MNSKFQLKLVIKQVMQKQARIEKLAYELETENEALESLRVPVVAFLERKIREWGAK